MNKKIKISIAVIILLIISVCTVNLLTTDTKTVVEISDDMVYYSQGKYIYMTYNGVYSMSNGSSEKLFEADECYSLFVQDEEIYLTYYENNNVNPIIAILDLNGNVLKTAKLKLEQDYEPDISIKAVIDNMIFVRNNPVGDCYVFDADENFELKTIEFKDNYESAFPVWAAKALPSAIEAPESDKVLQGWTVERPRHNFFNWWQNQTDARLVELEAKVTWLTELLKEHGIVVE